MKVARVIPFLDFGGIEKVVELIALEFFKNNSVEHSVIVLGPKGRVAKQLQNRGIEVICLDQNPKIPNLSLIFNLYKLFRLKQFEVVHTSGAEANFHGIIAGYLSGIRIRIAEEIGFPKHHLLWRVIFRFVYSLSTKVIVISEAVKKFLIANGELSSQKAKVIYNPAQIPYTLPNGKGKKDHLIFIMVCRLTPIKNIPATLKSFAELKPDYQQRYKLMIIGEGEQSDLLEKMVGELGLMKVVSFLGYQSNVSDYLHTADVFVIPSISEGSSVALAEAMLHGLPSIVTKVGGASEIIGTSESAVMVDPNNITEIKEAIQFFIDLQPSELAKMGSRAKEFAGINFSSQKYAWDLLSLYKNPF